MVQTLSQVRSLLSSHGLRPKRRYGQVFLHDGNQMARIVQEAAVQPGDLVLEVGPGTGGLTERLLTAGARLVAVEIDRDLEPILRQQVAACGGEVTLLFADVLAGKHRINPVVMQALVKAGHRGGQAKSSSAGVVGFKLVANLPYNAACPLLANLAVGADGVRMTEGVVMVQREVAERFTAGPGGKDYGPISVILQVVYHVEQVATLGPACFWPRPKVDSAVVRFRRRAQPLTDQPEALTELVHRVFGQRRKQLGHILGRGHLLPEGVDPAARPEQLSVAQWVALSQRVR